MTSDNLPEKIERKRLKGLKNMTLPKLLFASFSMSILASQPVVTGNTIDDNNAVFVIAQNAYQDKIWPSLKNHVPQVGNRKSLLCVFSKNLNLKPYNILLQELFREDFGDGVAEIMGDFLEKNSHDFSYQFHMQARKDGAVRINALDTQDSSINHNYIVDFYPNETFNFISYGKLPPTVQSREEILKIYKIFLPGILEKKCMDNFQYLES